MHISHANTPGQEPLKTQVLWVNIEKLKKGWISIATSILASDHANRQGQNFYNFCNFMLNTSLHLLQLLLKIMNNLFEDCAEDCLKVQARIHNTTENYLAGTLLFFDTQKRI